MIRAAVLVSGDGDLLQSVLDSMYFGQLPDFELVAVICTEKNEYALRRAASSGVQAIVVEPTDFPTRFSYAMALNNKLKDLDIEFVVLAGFRMPLGVIATQYRRRIIGVHPSLFPAFTGEDGAPVRTALERGWKVTGATAYFADAEGGFGPIIAQKAVDVLPDDNELSLSRRILEEAEWDILPRAIRLYCEGRLEIHGEKVVIK